MIRINMLQETADSILLYAFEKPIFVIDAYTRRVAARHLGLDGTGHYDILQKTFMDALPGPAPHSKPAAASPPGSQ